MSIRIIWPEIHSRKNERKENMLENKVALVTGASRGIGRAIAVKLASQGAYVIVNYVHSREKAQEVADEIAAAGGKAETYCCDVSGYQAVGRMIEELLEKCGHIDILVNNAGITRDQFIGKISEEAYDAVMDANCKSCFNTMHHLAAHFLERKSGRVINMSSTSGVLGNVAQANYAASKAAVIGLTKTMAREWAGRGITVNAIAPGFIKTDMTEVLSDKIKEKTIARIPMQRMGNPEDVAALTAFFASEEAGYITGQIVCVDGGMAI